MSLLAIIFGFAARYFHRSTRKAQAVAKLQLLCADGCQVRVLYDNLFEWDEKLGKLKYNPIPPSYKIQQNGTAVPYGIEGWIERNFGIDFLYEPVYMS